jgi:hypothetical protein
MADYLCIEEYGDEMPQTSKGGFLPIPPSHLAFQRVAIGAASAQSLALNAATKFVILTAEVPCHFAHAADPTASAATRFLSAGVPREFRAVGGNKIAAIARQA